MYINLIFRLRETRDTTARAMYLCRLSRECDDDVVLYPFSSQEQQTATEIPVLGNRFLRMRTTHKYIEMETNGE